MMKLKIALFVFVLIVSSGFVFSSVERPFVDNDMTSYVNQEISIGSNYSLTTSTSYGNAGQIAVSYDFDNDTINEFLFVDDNHFYVFGKELLLENSIILGTYTKCSNPIIYNSKVYSACYDNNYDLDLVEMNLTLALNRAIPVATNMSGTSIPSCKSNRCYLVVDYYDVNNGTLYEVNLNTENVTSLNLELVGDIMGDMSTIAISDLDNDGLDELAFIFGDYTNSYLYVTELNSSGDLIATSKQVTLYNGLNTIKIPVSIWDKDNTGLKLIVVVEGEVDVGLDDIYFSFFYSDGSVWKRSKLAGTNGMIGVKPIIQDINDDGYDDACAFLYTRDGSTPKRRFVCFDRLGNTLIDDINTTTGWSGYYGSLYYLSSKPNIFGALDGLYQVTCEPNCILTKVLNYSEKNSASLLIDNLDNDTQPEMVRISENLLEYYDFGEGIIYLNQTCMPSTNHVCLEPFLLDDELYCDLDDLYECPYTCFDYRCNDCAETLCIFVDNCINVSVSPKAYGWYMDNDTMYYRYKYINSIIGNALYFNTSEVTGTLYLDLPEYTADAYYVRFMMKVSSDNNTGIQILGYDTNSNQILHLKILNFDDYNRLYDWNSTDWELILDGATQTYGAWEHIYKITFRGSTCTIEVDEDWDGDYDYEINRTLPMSATELTQLQFIPTSSYSTGSIYMPFIEVYKSEEALTCDSFADDFDYGISIQTGGGWYGDVIYPGTEICSDAIQEILETWFPWLVNDYSFSSICFDGNYIGHTTNCYYLEQDFIMDYVLYPATADEHWFEIVFLSGSKNITLRIETSSSSTINPNSDKSRIKLWNGQEWINSTYEIQDWDYHRLYVNINFNYNLINVILDESILIFQYEPIYLDEPEIESIEIHHGDDDAILQIDRVLYEEEIPSYLDEGSPYEAPEEATFTSETGLQTHYSCGWNFSATDGNYFDWSLCTPEEQESKSTWCIIRLLGKCTIGNLTVWILNNILFTIVIIGLIALGLPFIVRSVKK